jgi:hypothetical protein
LLNLRNASLSQCLVTARFLAQAFIPTLVEPEAAGQFHAARSPANEDKLLAAGCLAHVFPVNQSVSRDRYHFFKRVI